MSEFYCDICAQRKKRKEFSTWLEDKTKARRCNDCLEIEKQKQRMQDHKSERAAKKPVVTAILKDLAKSLGSEHKREVNEKLYKLKEKRRLMDELGISEDEAIEIVEEAGPSI